MCVVYVDMCGFFYWPEQSSDDYVMFQAASAIKDAVLREWSLLSKDDIESLRTFLLAFALQKQR